MNTNGELTLTKKVTSVAIAHNVDSISDCTGRAGRSKLSDILFFESDIELFSLFLLLKYP